jgi:predicted MPP superfamily phosphohydrolase
MPLFLLIFIGLYGALNIYVLAKVAPVVAPGGPARVALVLMFALLVAAPVVVQGLERKGFFNAARAVGLVGHTWMPMVLWFCMLFLASDVWNLAMRLGGLGWPSMRGWMLPGKLVVPVAGAIVLVLTVWGFIEAQSIRLQRVEVPVAGLSPQLDGLRIAQVTDLHLGVNVGWMRLNRVVGLLRESQADVIVATGDIVDSPIDDAGPLAKALAGVDAPLGKYAVLGNHEYYTGLADSVAMHEMAGLRLLRGEAVEPAPGLVLVGVDDPAGKGMGAASSSDDSAVLPESRPPGGAVVLLKHQPRANPASVGRFDLQISGHAHGGQFIPWHLVTWSVYTTYSGMYDLGRGSRLYASPGAGTWGPRMRVMAPPEVTVFVLRRV